MICALQIGHGRSVGRQEKDIDQRKLVRWKLESPARSAKLHLGKKLGCFSRMALKMQLGSWLVHDFKLHFAAACGLTNLPFSANHMDQRLCGSVDLLIF